MISTEALFVIAHAAQAAGDHARALRSFERGAALGDIACLLRLGWMYDAGIGVEADKDFAMRCYQRAWRSDPSQAAANCIARLYCETGNFRAMFRWFERAAAQGDDGAKVDMAKCYLAGVGVRPSLGGAMKCLASAVSGSNICQAEREEAEALLAQLRPRLVAGGDPRA